MQHPDNIFNKEVPHGTKLQPKRTKDLLYAFSKINTKKDWSLTIVGDGLLMGELVKLTYELEINNNIVFVGQVADVETYIVKSDCLVICSEKEGMPNVVLEAMASGLPVIATKVGNIPEMLSEQKEMLLTSGDVKILSEKNEWRLDNPDELRVKGQKLHEFAQKHYSMQIVARNYIELYSRLLVK